MPTIETVRDWPGRVLVDRDGTRVGEIQEIYLDARTDQPEWALINTGLFGTKVSFVPILDAGLHGEEVRVPFEKAQIKDAPTIEPAGELSEYEESELYRHYGLPYDYDEDEGELAGVLGGRAATEQPTAPPPSGAELAGLPPEPGDDRSPSDNARDRVQDEIAPAPPPPGVVVAEATLPGQAPSVADAPPTDAPVGTRRRLRRWIVTEYVVRSDADGREQVVVDRQPLGEDDSLPG